MGFSLPNGATIQLAASYSASVPVTAISNANPAVATAAANGLSDGDIIAVSSGWTKLNNRAVRVSSASADSFDLESVDTTSVKSYVAGGGAGSIQKVASWAEISEVTEVATSGGEQQFASFGFLAEDEDRQLPTTKSASSLTLTVADDPEAGYVPLVEAADEDRQPRVVQLNLPNGSSILYNAYLSITATPTLSRNNIMTRVITLSLASRPSRYTESDGS